jgi:hypothetical protein
MNYEDVWKYNGENVGSKPRGEARVPSRLV